MSFISWRQKIDLIRFNMINGQWTQIVFLLVCFLFVCYIQRYACIYFLNLIFSLVQGPGRITYKNVTAVMRVILNNISENLAGLANHAHQRAATNC